MATKYTWAHINDRPLAEVKALLPNADVLTDGDCGSVWGEYHEGDKGKPSTEDTHCPYPHVLVRNPTLANLAALKRAGVGFVADTEAEWGEGETLSHNWVEDDMCNARDVFLIDYRTPYRVPSREPVYIIIERYWTQSLSIAYASTAEAEGDLESLFIDGLCEDDAIDCYLSLEPLEGSEIVIPPTQDERK